MQVDYPLARRRGAGSDETAEICRRHGEDPRQVGWIEHDVIDMPLLRFGIYLERDGQKYVECPPHLNKSTQHEHTDCPVAMTTREHALVGPLPHWLDDCAFCA